MAKISTIKTAAIQTTHAPRLARFHHVPLMPRILSSIRSSPDKRITFAQFMQMCLYDPDYGYYSSGNARIANFDEMGKSKSAGEFHFKTNPEWFYPQYGCVIAEALLSMWHSMGRPKAFPVIEMGAGMGGMAKGILDYLKNNYPKFYKKLNYTVLEISPVFARQQKIRLSKHKVNVINASALDFPFPNIRGAIISNELPDTFPLHRIIYNRNYLHIKEIFVAEKEGKLKEVTGPVSDNRIFEYLNRIQAKPLNGSLRVVNLGMVDWLQSLARSLEQGYILTIDYCSNVADTYMPNPVRIFNQSTSLADQLSNLRPLYDSPGNFDITANVHPDVYCSVANEAGLVPVFAGSEADFFRTIGGLWPNDVAPFKALMHAKNVTGSFQKQSSKVIILDRYFFLQKVFYPALEKLIPLSCEKELAKQLGKSADHSRREIFIWLSRELNRLFSSPAERVLDFSSAEAKLEEHFPELKPDMRKKLADLLADLPLNLPADFSTPTFRDDWLGREFGF